MADGYDGLAKNMEDHDAKRHARRGQGRRGDERRTSGRTS